MSKVKSTSQKPKVNKTLFLTNLDMEVGRISDFIKNTLDKTGFKKIVVAVSGGVDSATSLALCVKVLGVNNVFILMMPYGKTEEEDKYNTDELFKQLNFVKDNIFEMDIKPIVGLIIDQRSKIKDQNLDQNPKIETNKEVRDRLRLGNVMARVRMMVMYDFAKVNNCLVIGTENKSEYYLGYFTRFGDEASDLEPIRHLYKTQVYRLAKYLGVPNGILNKKPTAGLWKGQTDEKELGFNYYNADRVLFEVFDLGKSWEEIKYQKSNIKNKDQRLKILNDIEMIKKRVEGNEFKRETPYTMSNKQTRHKGQDRNNKQKKREF